MVEEAGGVLGGRPALVGLAVEDPQRVLQMTRPVGGAELVGPLGQEGGEQRDIAGLADGVAHGVQLERDGAQAEAGEEVVGQGDHLDVEVGVGRAQRLDPQLVVLAVAALLGVLVAEGGCPVPRLPRRHRVVLDVGAGDRRGALGPQRHQLAVAVLEDVHLLADHLARLADAAQEDSGVLEDGGDGEAVAGRLHQARRSWPRSPPSGRDSGQSTSCIPFGVRNGADDPAVMRAPSSSGGQTFLPGS